MSTRRVYWHIGSMALQGSPIAYEYTHTKGIEAKRVKKE